MRVFLQHDRLADFRAVTLADELHRVARLALGHHAVEHRRECRCVRAIAEADVDARTRADAEPFGVFCIRALFLLVNSIAFERREPDGLKNVREVRRIVVIERLVAVCERIVEIAHHNLCRIRRNLSALGYRDGCDAVDVVEVVVELPASDLPALVDEAEVERRERAEHAPTAIVHNHVIERMDEILRRVVRSGRDILAAIEL